MSIVKKRFYVLSREDDPFAVCFGSLDEAWYKLELLIAEQLLEDTRPGGCYSEGCSIEKYKRENAFTISRQVSAHGFSPLLKPRLPREAI